MEKKIMEEINENVINEGVTTSKGSLLPKLAVGALGVAAAVGAAIFLKKRKQNRDAEIAEFENCDVDNNDNEE